MTGEKFVSKNSVEIYIRGNGKRVSSQLIEQLDEEVKKILEAAIKRTERNGRNTVMPHDL